MRGSAGHVQNRLLVPSREDFREVHGLPLESGDSDHAYMLIPKDHE